MNELQEVANKAKQEELEELREMSEVFENIVESRVDIDLQTFEVYLLPFIIGELERDETNSMVFLTNYVKIAGNVKTGLNVIKKIDDETNELIYKLPPIMLDNPKTGHGINFTALVSLINKDSLVAKVQADKALNNISNKLEDSINLEDDILKEYRETLTKIFSDYKDRVLKAKPEMKDKITDVEDELEDDFIDY